VPPEESGTLGARFMNARMYAVTPAVENTWRTLLEHVTHDAGVSLDYLPYPAPQPLEALWRRADLGAVFMCGYPVMLGIAPVEVLAAPIPALAWANGQPLYRTDLIVRAAASYRTLEDTFGGRLGWTVEHSHSGFNALRHHLLPFRSALQPRLYHEIQGHLVTARNVLEAVRDGRIDIGPLDAYWHALLARHAPQLTEGVRVLASTALAPIPAFVAAAGTPPDLTQRLREAFSQAAQRSWFAALAEPLLLKGFAAVTKESFAPLAAWHREAIDAGYAYPA
jgi:ABC-type phosphate/phosphonate transport system substrate-binding protein